MKIIKQSWSWLQKPDEILKKIEAIGRTCYKSEDKITHDSAAKFVSALIRHGHESVIEHVNATVRFITNRGVTHELVRHRLCSFSQESTRYVRYDGEMEFVQPVWWDDKNYPEARKQIWRDAMAYAEKSYQKALVAGDTPDQAREILPNALKTEVVVTANLRQWRHIFKLRCDKRAHPQIRHLMLECLRGFVEEFPEIFTDLLELFEI